MAKLDGMIHQAKPPKKLKSVKKDKIIMRRLGRIVRPDGIWLDNLT